LNLNLLDLILQQLTLRFNSYRNSNLNIILKVENCVFLKLEGNKQSLGNVLDGLAN